MEDYGGSIVEPVLVEDESEEDDEYNQRSYKDVDEYEDEDGNMDYMERLQTQTGQELDEEDMLHDL